MGSLLQAWGAGKRTVVAVAWWATALAVAAAACGGRPGSPDAAADTARRDATSDSDARDAHRSGDAGRASDAGDAGHASDAAVPFLDFAKPVAAVVYTNAAVTVQIGTSAPPPTTVDVLVDGAPVLQLSPPFSGTLPTSGYSEGRHALDCRATFVGVQAACVTRTLVVDRTPPTIVGTTPFQYEYAAAGELISVRFSEPIAAASATAATFQVQADGAPLAGSPVLSGGGQTLASGVTTHPAKATGNAILKGTITDLAGNPLGRDTTWTWRWANAVSVGPSLPSQVGESGGFDPSIAAGPDGLPVVAWTTEGTTVEPTRLVVQRWDGTSWIKVASFPDQPTQLVLQIDSSVAVDRNGRVLVAWTDQDMGAGTFAVRVRAQAGAAWEAWDDVPVGNRPHLVVDDAGDVSLSMIVETPSAHAAVFRRASTGWQPVGDLMIPAGAQLSDTGGMAGDAAGGLEIAWSDQVGSVQFVPTVLSWTGSAWTRQTLPPASGLGYVGLFVGMNRAGAAAFAWSEQTIPNPSTAAVFVPGWTDRRIVGGFSGAGVLDVDVDPVGLPLVTFSQTTTLQVERWSGAAWEAVLDQIHMNPTPDSYPSGRLALDDRGKPFLVLQERTGGHPSLYVVTTP